MAKSQEIASFQESEVDQLQSSQEDEIEDFKTQKPYKRSRTTHSTS